MTLKEFSNWCNERACDGKWGMVEAMTCSGLLREIKSIPFWKRNKVWNEKYANDVYEEIVKPTNELIEKYR